MNGEPTMTTLACAARIDATALCSQNGKAEHVALYGMVAITRPADGVKQ